jgi:hypothetical protein
MHTRAIADPRRPRIFPEILQMRRRQVANVEPGWDLGFEKRIESFDRQATSDRGLPATATAAAGNFAADVGAGSRETQVSGSVTQPSERSR